MTAEDVLLRRRGYQRASVAMVVTTAATLAALAFAFPDPHGHSVFVAFAHFARQAWLTVAASIFVGCAVAAFVYAHAAGPRRAK